MLTILIDGHNLIPFTGLSLEDADDEVQLVGLLQAYARSQKAPQVEVFFDKAAPGRSGTRKFGLVRAHFVPRSSSADAAIEKRLQQMGRQARSATVISSDRRVQNSAKSFGSRVISSEDFARSLREKPGHSEVEDDRHGLDEGDLDEWLDLFRQKK
jgi:predicted RNA-binding protein with PIN domain